MWKWPNSVTYFLAGGFTSPITPMCVVGRKSLTLIVNIALSLKALAVLRTKGVNQQQSHGQDRSAPVQLGAAGHDITQRNTIPRQPCCEQHQPKGAWSKPATVN